MSPTRPVVFSSLRAACAAQLAIMGPSWLGNPHSQTHKAPPSPPTVISKNRHTPATPMKLIRKLIGVCIPHCSMIAASGIGFPPQLLLRLDQRAKFDSHRSKIWLQLRVDGKRRGLERDLLRELRRQSAHRRARGIEVSIECTHWSTSSCADVAGPQSSRAESRNTAPQGQ